MIEVGVDLTVSLMLLSSLHFSRVNLKAGRPLLQISVCSLCVYMYVHPYRTRPVFSPVFFHTDFVQFLVAALRSKYTRAGLLW